jgi:hypothetical protein
MLTTAGERRRMLGIVNRLTSATLASVYFLGMGLAGGDYVMATCNLRASKPTNPGNDQTAKQAGNLEETRGRISSAFPFHAILPMHNALTASDERPGPSCG